MKSNRDASAFLWAFHSDGVVSKDGTVRYDRGDIVVLVEEATHHHRPKPKNSLVVGRKYRVAWTYSDPTLLLHPLDHHDDNDFSTEWYCDPECVRPASEVSDEEVQQAIASIMRSVQ